MNSRSLGIMIAGGILVVMFLIMVGYLLEGLYPAVDRTFRVTEFSTSSSVSGAGHSIGARGLVFRGPENPVVLCLVDLFELRGAEYARWCQALADAAGTGRERVMLVCAGGGDRPIADPDARALLEAVAGTRGKLLIPEEIDRSLTRLTKTIETALVDPSDDKKTKETSLDWRAWLKKHVNIESSVRGVGKVATEGSDGFRFRSTALIVKPDQELSSEEWHVKLGGENVSPVERLQAALALSLESQMGALTHLGCLDLRDTLVLSVPGFSDGINRRIADKIRPDVDLYVLENRNGWPGSNSAPFTLEDTDYVAPMRDGLWRVCEGAPPRQLVNSAAISLRNITSSVSLSTLRGRPWSLGLLANSDLQILSGGKHAGISFSGLPVLKQPQIGLAPGRPDQDRFLALTGQRDGMGVFHLLALDGVNTATERLSDKRPGRCKILPGSFLETTLGRTLVPAVWCPPGQSFGKLDVYFTDDGTNWQRMERTENPDEPGFSVAAFLERRNGSLYLVGETSGQGLVSAVSQDRGETWRHYAPFSSRKGARLVALHRITSLGDWLLVIESEEGLGFFLSRSEGESWTPFAVPLEWAGLNRFQLCSSGATVTGAGIDSMGGLRVVPIRVDQISPKQAATTDG